jgi:cytochrome o ubiquinol oxidase subunit 2
MASNRPLFRLGSSCVAAALGPATPTARAEGVIAPWGAVGSSELQLLYESLGVMLVVVIPVIVLTLGFAWWFRASNKSATYRPGWSYSGKVEFTVWIIPLLVVLFLSAITWAGSHELDPYRPVHAPNNRLRVEVIAMDWRWLFIYPELGVASINELALPLDTPVAMNITSATVMNAIFIPGLAGQIYAMNGMCTQLSVIAGKPGLYRGLSTQFSGDGFSDMHFEVLAANRDTFDLWIERLRQSGQILDKAAYEQLIAQHASGQTSHYGYAEDGLFDYALQRGTRPASEVVETMVDPSIGSCRDTRLTNGVD